MTNIILSGAFGRMGRETAKVVKQQNEAFKICFGVDKAFMLQYDDFPVCPSFKNLTPDKNCVVVDFSSPELTVEALAFAVANGLPMVICTTGLSASDYDKIKAASEIIPVFCDSNVAPGIAYVKKAVVECAKLLDDSFDVEIIEYHHRDKTDYPSGTALSIAKEIMAVKPGYNISFRGYGEGSRCQKEIGIHSVRGGTVTGKHEILFIGDDEVITFSHSAGSKRIFALGALRAANFVQQQKNGLYCLKSIL